jgi:hypothetical protein
MATRPSNAALAIRRWTTPSPRTKPKRQRDEQFERLKPRILDCASRKYFAGQFENGEPRILVKTADLTPG